MRTVVIGARHASAWSNVPQGPPVIQFIVRKVALWAIVNVMA